MRLKPDRGTKRGRHILMCSPDHFRIEYEINPWMRLLDTVDRKVALEQWEALYRVLKEQLGADVELIPPAEGLPDLVFAANAGLAIGGKVITSGFRHPERQREEPFWQRWFTEHGYEVTTLPSGCPFEGEGDALFVEDLLVVGHRFRSTREAVQDIARIYSLETLVLELADPWFYHLDTCLCPINKDTALYVPDAFTSKSRDAIEHRFPDAITVPMEEAHRFACNSIVMGNDVVMSHDCPATQAELVFRGYRVHVVEITEFLKSGGGAKCLMMFLDHDALTAEAVGGRRENQRVGKWTRGTERRGGGR